MKPLTATALTFMVAATASDALHLDSSSKSSPSIVSFKTQRRHVANPQRRDSLRRRQTVTETLSNEQTLYLANVTLGTPPQDFSLSIDTGSSDLWVNAPASQVCQSRRRPCTDSGTYDANSSSTYVYVASNFEVAYVDGSQAAGDYVKDTLTIGAKNLDAFQFGVGYQSSSPLGILGIGYTSNEAQVNRERERAYSNLPQALVDANLIKSTAYSLWLDDLEANTGSILFGGVDTDKFTGQLESLPTQQEFGQYHNFIITLTDITITNDGNKQNLTTDLPLPVILDSGSSLTYLPTDLADAIYQALNVQYDQRSGIAVAACDLADQDVTLNFTFTSPSISVPVRELIIASGEQDGSQETFSRGDSACVFGISPAEGSTAVLGDTFLRSAYVVFDLENNEVSLAQTNFNSTSTSITEIGSGTTAVPGASDVPNPVQKAVSQTGGSRVAGITGSATTSASDPWLPGIPYGLLFRLCFTAILISCM